MKRLIIFLLISLIPSSLFCQTRVVMLPVIDKMDQVSYAHHLLLRTNITTAIAQTEGFEAYDGADLSSVFDEHDFQRKGHISYIDIHKIGNLTGADYLIITEAAKLNGGSMIAVVKIVDVESARIINTSQAIVDISDLEQMAKDCQSLTAKLLGTTNVLTSHDFRHNRQPVRSDKGDIRIDDSNTGMEAKGLEDIQEDVEEDVEDEPIPFAIVDEKPKFQGQDPAIEFSRWVGEHLVYPETAKENGVQGRVTLQFTVEKDGSVKKVKILRGVDPLLDQEAVRVVNKSPKWTPGKHRGRAVPVTYTFPFIFQLR